jgi:hypothetical protein
MKRCVVLSLLVVAVAGRSRAGDAYPIKVYPCSRLESPPVVDGALADECWATAPLVSGFTYYNKPKLLEVQTSFRVGYDEKFLYFGVHSDEPNAKRLTPSYAGRDSSGCFRGETIEVFLDPHHSHSDYYQLAVNLAGSFYDAFKHETSWNSTTRLKTKVVADGWELELAIPWREIGITAPKPGMVLGFNVCRDRYAGGAREWSNWSQTMANFHDVARFAHLVLSPTAEMLGKLRAELRRGDRRGPVLIFTREGYAGRAYLAMAREALRQLDSQLELLAGEAARERVAAAREEVTKRLEAARRQMEPYRTRLQAGKALDGAEWTRLSVEMTALSARFRELVWEARLAALLKGI